MFQYLVTYDSNGEQAEKKISLSFIDFLSLIMKLLPESELAQKHSFQSITDFANILSDDLKICLAEYSEISLKQISSIEIIKEENV